MPEVSIITPMYNSADFLDSMIESVLMQTFKDWELILVDDCSSDSSVDIVNKYAVGDNRIKLIKLAYNSGAAVARNTAIEAASGRFVAFLDSDDMWLPEKLRLQIEFMKAENVALSYTSYHVISEESVRVGSTIKAYKELTYSDMLKSNKIGCLTAVYDISRLGKVYMPLIRKRQDYALWLKILRKISVAKGLEQPLSLYRRRTGSISSNKIEMIKYHWQLFKNIEKISTHKTIYYLACNIFNKMKSR